MYWCRFIGCNKCTPGGALTTTWEAWFVWGQDIIGTLCTFSQLCCEPKTAQKIKSFLKWQRRQSGLISIIILIAPEEFRKLVVTSDLLMSRWVKWHLLLSLRHHNLSHHFISVTLTISKNKEYWLYFFRSLGNTVFVGRSWGDGKSYFIHSFSIVD